MSSQLEVLDWLQEASLEKRAAVMAKYRAASENRAGQLRGNGGRVYAFGSSTPRVLAYLQSLPEDQRVYDKKLKAQPLSPAELDELKRSDMTSSLYQPRPTSRAASARPSSRLNASKGSQVFLSCQPSSPASLVAREFVE